MALHYKKDLDIHQQFWNVSLSTLILTLYSEKLRVADPNNNCLSLGQAFQTYPSPNTLVWSDIGEEDIGGLRSQVSKNVRES